MKRDTTGIAMPINKNNLEKLLTITEERVAKEIVFGNETKNFGVIDMWNIQRKHRSVKDLRRRHN